MKKLPTINYDFSNNPKMSEPATGKQLEWMLKLGYPKEQKFTKGECSKIIGDQPANSKQILRLQAAGYDCSEGVTMAQWYMVVNSDTWFKESLIHDRNVLFPKRPKE